MGNITLEQIHCDLEFLKKEIIEIKKHVVDADTLLTPEENEELENSLKNFKQGKTKGFDKIEKELDL